MVDFTTHDVMILTHETLTHDVTILTHDELPYIIFSLHVLRTKYALHMT
jgi:hypothetical protein